MKKVIFIAAVVVALFAVYSVLQNDKGNRVKVLVPVKSVNLLIPETSGLFLNKSNQTFFTVSDENSKIYKFDLNGKVLDSIKVNGFDLEGITQLNDSVLITILERDRDVLFISKIGVEKNKFHLNLMGELNKGLEGITYNKNNNYIYILNEKDPGLLFTCSLDGEIKAKTELSYRSDYSGIDYVDETNELWIVCDESESILVCDLNGDLKKAFKTNIEQAEGIAVDYDNKLFYLVSDPLNTLYIYELPE